MAFNNKKYLTRCPRGLNARFLIFIGLVSLILVLTGGFLTEHLWEQVLKDTVFNKNVVTPFVRPQLADCKAMINGSQVEINRTLRLVSVIKKNFLTPNYYLARTKNCSQFLKERMYINKALTKEEADFPIAYSIMIYKDIEQFERLLRAIYRPQNYYCIHVDVKSPKIFHRAVRSLIACFPNVFMASTLIDVKWGQFSALKPDIICMKDLWRRYKRWKYFINLTGQEFPLRTNNELVDILRTYNGTADIKIEAPFSKSHQGTRDRIKYIYRDGKRTDKLLQPPTYNVSFTKGECHVILPRSFVDYVCKSWVANDFLRWLKQTNVPDETYFATLNHSPLLKIPGSYTGNRNNYARYKNWQSKIVVPCYGKVVRGICVNGVADISFIAKQPQFFVNKFHLDFQYLALDCLEEWFYNRTRAYYQGEMVFDVAPYVFNEDNHGRT